MGPLSGVKVIEVGGIGPNPFAGMLLSDMGADVLRLHRPGMDGLLGPGAGDVVNRGRPAIPVDIKKPEGRELVLRLIETADVLIEGFRPGVMERAGLGPDEAHARNPRLVYGRVTGYGQDGPLSQVAGHDINYISIAGVLGAIGRAGEPPIPPMNLVADYGGGGMLLAFGVVCALLEARASGQGQVIDAAMVEGASLLATVMHGLMAMGIWSTEHGTNVLDTGAHFYEVYECADGRHIAVGAIEPQFYDELLRLMEIDPDDVPQWARDRWPEFKQLFAAKFRTRTRDEWAAILEPAEACATPVLTLGEAPSHPHNVARGSFVDDGVVQPRPAPRFSRTAPEVSRELPTSGEALAAWGLGEDEIASLLEPASQR